MNRLARRSSSQGNDDDSVLPLINVVFLLLIFFMLAGQLASSDPFEIEPPTSMVEGMPAAQEVLILLSHDGRIAVDGQDVDEAGVPGLIRELGAEKVRLKADGAADAVLVVALMELLREAGVTKLDLLTLPVAE